MNANRKRAHTSKTSCLSASPTLTSERANTRSAPVAARTDGPDLDVEYVVLDIAGSSNEIRNGDQTRGKEWGLTYFHPNVGSMVTESVRRWSMELWQHQE